jgi:predicted glycosyltransferase
MIFHNMPHILPQKDAGFPFTEELAHPRWLDVSESLPGGNDQNDQPGVAGLECSHTQFRCNVFIRKHGNLDDYRVRQKHKQSVKYLRLQLVAFKSVSGLLF